VACIRTLRSRHGPERFGSSRRIRSSLQTSPFQCPGPETSSFERSSRG
jgi:hypothetical protein